VWNATFLFQIIHLPHRQGLELRETHHGQNSGNKKKVGKPPEEERTILNNAMGGKKEGEEAKRMGTETIHG